MSEPSDPGPVYLRRKVPEQHLVEAHIAKMSKSHNPSGIDGKYHIHCSAP